MFFFTSSSAVGVLGSAPSASTAAATAKTGKSAFLIIALRTLLPAGIYRASDSSRETSLLPRGREEAPGRRPEATHVRPRAVPRARRRGRRVPLGRDRRLQSWRKDLRRHRHGRFPVLGRFQAPCGGARGRTGASVRSRRGL